jgi:glycolate oxidase
MIAMPPPDPATLARRPELLRRLAAILPPTGIIADDRSLKPYETDALTAYRQVPMVAVLPETTAQVAAILKLCGELGVPVVPRGAGTSLSGGALPVADGLLLGMGKFNRVLDDRLCQPLPRCSPASPIWASPGRWKGAASTTRPIRQSQIACTIGGNVAENSGGVHCLKYGLTTNNLLGIESC